MARRRKRGLAKGRYERGECFATIKDEVLTSTAYTALPHYARSLLIAIAAQYRGSNNSNLSMTGSLARTYGISPAELSAGLKLLEEVGLIQKTRQGCISRGKGVCSLFALSWFEISPCDKTDPPILAARPAPNSWASWARPPDWKSRLKAAKSVAKGRKTPSPDAGGDPAPPWGMKVGSADPHVGSC